MLKATVTSEDHGNIILVSSSNYSFVFISPPYVQQYNPAISNTNTAQAVGIELPKRE